jgi:2,5-diketo-D-gluconate reductase A
LQEWAGASAPWRTNADIFGFALDAEDLAAIEKMDRGDGVAWAMGDPTKAP